ncbi:BtrH N-terminal domain-containing protein [Galbibacter sp.]|uniref:BtrH N-terminal domain-containing protein n=1 Tax=Galbibacter sp. TaxID=2918471 RepID=UPI003A95953E
MKIEDFEPFTGQHCETTAAGNLLKQIGIELSEPMLFGLGEGLGYIFWYMKSMDFPFIGGRVKADLLTKNLCRNLNLNLVVKETSSRQKAWTNVKAEIDRGKTVGLKLDCYHLDYFTNKIHFAGHYVAIYGYDHEFAYLIDTDQQGGRARTTLNSLALARDERGPMSSKNRSFTITGSNQSVNLQKVLRQTIRNNAISFLNPPIKNIGLKGILKTASEIKKWYKSTNTISRDFQTIAMLMEKAGTGGSLFRNLYRDFLLESAELLECKHIKEAHTQYAIVAELWKRVSELFYEVGNTHEIKYIDQASELLIEIAERERNIMVELNNSLG